MTSEESEARVALAAAHRIVAHFGWDNVTYNHVTLRVPGEPDCFLLKPDGLMFSEVAASSLVKLTLDGKAVDQNRPVQTAGFNIHTAVLKARPEINCVIHVHTEAGMAIAAMEGGLLPLSQGSIRFYNRLAFHEYEGISDAASEQERIARDLGGNRAMILRNHGLLTCGRTIGEAIMMMKYLVDSCELQLRVQATGAEMRLPSPEICERAALQWDAHDKRGNLMEWQALRRLADQHYPDHRH